MTVRRIVTIVRGRNIYTPRVRDNREEEAYGRTKPLNDILYPRVHVTRALRFNPHWAYLFCQTDGDSVEQKGQRLDISVSRWKNHRENKREAETETRDGSLQWGDNLIDEGSGY